VKSDRTTKVLLLAIAAGVWLNLLVNIDQLSAISSDLSFLQEWALRGAPVTPSR
jgi:hypothetical protein